MSEFYYWQLGQKRDEILLKLPKEYDDQKLMTGKIVLNNLSAKVKAGKKFYDVISYYDAPLNFGISEKIYITLNKINATGWKTYKVQIQNNADKVYYGFQVTGKCGKLKDEPEGDVV